MSLVVTGATGHFGRHVVETLLDRGVPADTIVAGGRRMEALDDLAARGVRVVPIDYEDPATLDAALAGAEKLLLVSGLDFGKRVAQHTAVIEAAQKAGVSSIAYTSAPFADTTSNPVAVEHKATEEVIRATGLPFTFLRNGWYFENYTAQIPTYLQFGAVTGAAGEGRISGAARAEQAEAAAAVLTGEGHENAIYELGGDTSFSLGELAALVATYSGKPVAYTNVPVPQFAQILEGAGMPGPVAAVFADVDRSIEQGDLFIETGDLSRLIGRPTSTLEDAVRAYFA